MPTSFASLIIVAAIALALAGASVYVVAGVCILAALVEFLLLMWIAARPDAPAAADS
jgi:hypothetical protein